jgi:hypothetical protein
VKERKNEGRKEGRKEGVNIVSFAKNPDFLNFLKLGNLNSWARQSSEDAEQGLSLE